MRDMDYSCSREARLLGEHPVAGRHHPVWCRASASWLVVLAAWLPPACQAGVTIIDDLNERLASTDVVALVDIVAVNENSNGCCDAGCNPNGCCNFAGYEGCVIEFTATFRRIEALWSSPWGGGDGGQEGTILTFRQTVDPRMALGVYLVFLDRAGPTRYRGGGFMVRLDSNGRIQPAAEPSLSETGKHFAGLTIAEARAMLSQHAVPDQRQTLKAIAIGVSRADWPADPPSACRVWISTGDSLGRRGDSDGPDSHSHELHGFVDCAAVAGLPSSTSQNTEGGAFVVTGHWERGCFHIEQVEALGKARTEETDRQAESMPR